MGAIYLIRHGQASFGHDDYDRLSPLGLAQSARLGEALRAIGIAPNAIVRGTMRRHAKTASVCLQAMGIDVAPHIDPGLDEYDHEDILARLDPELATPQGIAARMMRAPDPRAAFQELFAQAVQRWIEGEHDDDYRESWPAFRSRVIAALERMIATGGSGHVTLAFTSGGVISVIVGHVLGLPDASIRRLNWVIANTGVTRLIYGRQRVMLSYFNNYRHLEGDRRMLSYR